MTNHTVDDCYKLNRAEKLINDWNKKANKVHEVTRDKDAKNEKEAKTAKGLCQK